MFTHLRAKLKINDEFYKQEKGKRDIEIRLKFHQLSLLKLASQLRRVSISLHFAVLKGAHI